MLKTWRWTSPCERIEPMVDLDPKTTDVFAGKVVRKDLVRKVKVGANVPVYVLEYLIGKYCATDDPVADRGGPAHGQPDHRPELHPARRGQQGPVRTQGPRQGDLHRQGAGPGLGGQGLGGDGELRQQVSPRAGPPHPQVSAHPGARRVGAGGPRIPSDRRRGARRQGPPLLHHRHTPHPAGQLRLRAVRGGPHASSPPRSGWTSSSGRSASNPPTTTVA